MNILFRSIIATLLVLVVVTLVTGCGNYNFEKITTTTTTFPDGRVVTVENVCRAGIKSTREIKNGALNVSNDCALHGSAEKLGLNDELVKLSGQIVSKLPAIPIPLP